MEPAQLVITSLHLVDFLASVQIKDAYLTYQHSLCFAEGKQYYQLVALPLGISNAPWVFTKVIFHALTDLFSRHPHCGISEQSTAEVTSGSGSVCQCQLGTPDLMESWLRS